MQYFTPIQYTAIAIANAYGLDKNNWDERLDWANDFTSLAIKSPDHSQVQEAFQKAKEPLLMQKALIAYKDGLAGKPTGYIMGLDATCSGLQLLACLTGCHTTAKAVNLINTNKRECAYTMIGDIMGLSSTICKQPTMTHFYNSTKNPKAVFKELYPLFLETVSKVLPGAEAARQVIQSCVNSTTTEYVLYAPDGHTCRIKTKVAVDKPIEIDELGHKTFTHRIYENIPNKNDLSLVANITHLFDGYVMRTMKRKAEKQLFSLISTHDCFWTHPNHMHKVRKDYIDILADIADNNYLEPILQQVTGNPDLRFIKASNDLGDLIRESEYPLC